MNRISKSQMQIASLSMTATFRAKQTLPLVIDTDSSTCTGNKKQSIDQPRRANTPKAPLPVHQTNSSIHQPNQFI
jgi:hypothetical protein